MGCRKIPHPGDTKECFGTGSKPTAVVILSEVHIYMDVVVAGIFDARRQFRHQALLGIKDIPYTSGKGVGESALLKDI